MTTYQHGKQPDGAPVTYHTDGLGFILRIEHQNGSIVTRSQVRRDEAESICRAFHLAKLAEDYVRACDRSDELSDSDPFLETAEGRARAKAADAARAAMVKSVRA